MIFDLGATRPTDSIVVSMLRDPKGAIADYVKTHIGVGGVESESLFASLVGYKIFDWKRTLECGAPAFISYQSIFVYVRTKQGNVGYFMIGEDGARQLAFVKPPGKDSIKKQQRPPFEALLTPPANRYYGLHSYLPLFYKDKWRAARYEQESLLPREKEFGDDFFKSSRLEIAQLVSVSKGEFETARFIALAIKQQERQGSIFQPRHRNTKTAGEGICASVAAAGIVGGVVAAVTYLAPICLLGPLCFLLGVEIGALAIIAGIGAAILCGQLNPDPPQQPQQQQPQGPAVAGNGTTDDNGDGDPVNILATSGAAGDVGDGGALPIEETDDPFLA